MVWRVAHAYLRFAGRAHSRESRQCERVHVWRRLAEALWVKESALASRGQRWDVAKRIARYENVPDVGEDLVGCKPMPQHRENHLWGGNVREHIARERENVIR